EQLICNQKVEGSTPSVGTNSLQAGEKLRDQIDILWRQRLRRRGHVAICGRTGHAAQILPWTRWRRDACADYGRRAA
ncbi:MAG: hypothetical protein ABI854_01330, partial [Betaproteobacteria bacterium]